MLNAYNCQRHALRYARTVARPAQTRAAELAAIEAALIRLRRRQTRRALGRAAAEGASPQVNLDHFAVLDAVEGGGPGEVTVGDVAERLGIDPSRASRVVAAAVKAGYLERVASQDDGRRSCLALTATGREIVDHAHRSRQAMIDEVLRDWSARDRADLARLLTRFTTALDAPTPHSRLI
jgi:DNA-binding MarR family transcriptional regulator